MSERTQEQDGAMPAALAAILSEPGWVCNDAMDFCTNENFGGYLGITVETIRGRRCAYVEDGDGNLLPNHTLHQVSDAIRRIEAALAAAPDQESK